MRGVGLESRDIQPDDAERLIAFHAGLSPETKYRRFFAAHPVLPAAEVSHFTRVDGDDRVALVVTENTAIIAVARYDRNPERPDEAEVAFVVTDGWQGEGIGTMLFDALVEIAGQHSIRRFVADTLSNNVEMMRIFRHSTFELSTGYDHGVAHVEFPITQRATRQASEVAEGSRLTD